MREWVPSKTSHDCIKVVQVANPREASDDHPSLCEEFLAEHGHGADDVAGRKVILGHSDLQLKQLVHGVRLVQAGPREQTWIKYQYAR